MQQSKSHLTAHTKSGFFEKILQSRALLYCMIFPIALFMYRDLLGCFFFAEDFAFLHAAVYNFDLHNTLIDRYLTGFFYRPLSFDFSMKLGYILSGLNPIGYRLIILFLFSLTCIMVYEIITILTRRKDIGLLAAFFFLTREAHSSAIYWLAAGFQQIEATLFMLSTFYLFLRYKQSLRFGFYLGSLLCAVLGVLARESAIVLPALIIAIEYTWGKSLKNLFSRGTILRVLPFFMVSAIPLLRLILNTPLSHSKNIYSSSFYLSAPIKNLAFFIVHSFNMAPEMYILSVWILALCLRWGQRKKVFSAFGLFFLGIAPHINITRGLSSYYLCFSLVGVALLISIGLRPIQERAPALKPLVVMLLLILFFTTFSTARKSRNSCEAYFQMEQTARESITFIKKKFPELPDESFIYIQNSNARLSRALGRHTAFQLFYNNSISVCFEGITKEAALPKQCSGIYLFNYQNKKLKFISFTEGRFLKTFLKEHFFSDSSS